MHECWFIIADKNDINRERNSYELSVNSSAYWEQATFVLTGIDLRTGIDDKLRPTSLTMSALNCCCRRRVVNKLASIYCGIRYCGAIGVARGCSGCTCTPRAVKKFSRPNLQEKCVSAPPGHEVHPRPEQESIFRIVFAGFGGIFRQSLRATTKKGHQLFWQKSAPPDKILPTPMCGATVYRVTDVYENRREARVQPYICATPFHWRKHLNLLRGLCYVQSGPEKKLHKV